eukprot:gnl/TRDRNA2_/TRDRNA2_183178_c0_seq1.p1 gnl/TRDRNA2_/TRDRNA2_183178_c0~~gnl/TRDRNA2_/TRDRNA2_183178_c0_seq1.p1  ORF type:complete len:281 (+),score=48.15 gnl/TRDRNA2_/TRDRNA2_183178_c0_seq1:14-856(+)
MPRCRQAMEAYTQRPMDDRSSTTSVICVRRKPPVKGADEPHDIDTSGQATGECGLAGPRRAMFSSGWQVLMGQQEAEHRVRDGEGAMWVTRFPGQLTFPGGSVEAGETPERSATRQLREFGLALRPSDKLRLLSVKRSCEAESKSIAVHHNFVLHEEESPCLVALDMDTWNARHRRCQASAWREPLQRIVWLDMADAARLAYFSMGFEKACSFDEFQEEAFARLALVCRDPVFLNLMKLLQAVPSSAEGRSDDIREVLLSSRPDTIWMQDVRRWPQTSRL